MKKLNKVTYLVIAVLLGGILLTDPVGSFLAKDSAESVSGNSVSGNRVINTFGFSESYADMLNAEVKPDCIHYTAVDYGTWWFDESFARGELLNAFDEARMNPDNWVDHDGDIKVTHPTLEQSYRYMNPNTGLSNYDYELERLAMQRCIEVAYAVTIEHTRPNVAPAEQVYISENSKLFPIINDVAEINGGHSPNDTAEDIVNKYMDSFSHHVKVVQGRYCRIGIAVLRNFEGDIYTCIEYSEQIPKWFADTYENNYTAPCNSFLPLTIDISRSWHEIGDTSMTGLVEDKISSMKSLRDAKPVLNVGESISLSKIHMSMKSGVILDKFASDAVYGRNWVTERRGVISYDPATDTVTALQPPETYERDADWCVSCMLETQGASIYFRVYAPIKEEPWIIAPTPTPSPSVLGGSNPTSWKHTQHVTVRKKSYTFNSKSLKRSSKSFYVGAVSESGPISYKLVSYPKKGKKYVKFSRGGKVTFKRGAKKGIYKIRLTAAETYSYKSASRVIKIKIK